MSVPTGPDPTPRGARRVSGGHVVGHALDLAAGLVPLHLEAGVGHQVEGPVVATRASRPPGGGRRGPDRVTTGRRSAGYLGTTSSPSATNRAGQTVAVAGVDGGGIGHRQGAERSLVAASEAPGARRPSGRSGVTPGYPSPNRSAKADISSWTWLELAGHRGGRPPGGMPRPTRRRPRPARWWWAGSPTARARWRPGRDRPPRPPPGSGRAGWTGTSGARPRGWKPSPRRPARRAAASLCPPMWTGTPPGRTGLGNEWAWRNETNSPSKSAPAGPESAHRARMAAMVSSVRRPRLRGSAPVARSSSSIHPTPTHIRTRPPDRTSTVAIRLASTTGLVVGHHQHPGGQGDPLGDGGQVGHEVQRVGDPAVVGQRHLPRRGVGVGALVVRDHHGVLHQHHRLEAAGLGVTGERGHPGRVGGDAQTDRGDDSELHGLLTFGRQLGSAPERGVGVPDGPVRA